MLLGPPQLPSQETKSTLGVASAYSAFSARLEAVSLPSSSSLRPGLSPVEMLPSAPCCPEDESQVVHTLTNDWLFHQAPGPCLAKPGPFHLCDRVLPTSMSAATFSNSCSLFHMQY